MLKINGARLWSSIMESGRIGATEKGGLMRPALGAQDHAVRDLFRGWCEEAGCTVLVDSVGNMFARRAGRDPARPAIAMGSHLDTQMPGGRFDGIFGVMAGLEVVRTLNDAGIETEAPLEIVNWTNEEGARFQPAMLGSGVHCGIFTQAYAEGRIDDDGISFAQALDAIGYRGTAVPGDHPIGAYVECHIEQGPILEEAGLQVGAVTGSLGLKWFDCTLTGVEAHAGPTPMHLRKDPLIGFAEIVQAVRKLAMGNGDAARSTIGRVSALPGSRNVIPAQVAFSVDIRHESEDELADMQSRLFRAMQDIAAALDLRLAIEELWHMKVVRFDDAIVRSIEASAQRRGIAHRRMITGAGHDALSLSAMVPTAMIFVPCENGISHNEAENATPEDLEAGCNVLMDVVCDLAGVRA